MEQQPETLHIFVCDTFEVVSVPLPVMGIEVPRVSHAPFLAWIAPIVHLVGVNIFARPPTGTRFIVGYSHIAAAA